MFSVLSNYLCKFTFILLDLDVLYLLIDNFFKI